MSTTLLSAEVALSKDIGDYWRGTTTGAGLTTTVVDTALMAKTNDWINREAFLFVEDMTGDTYNEAERKISSLDNSTGTLTVLPIGGALGVGAVYRVHRLFNASDKRSALIDSLRPSYPFIFKNVWDESKRAGNWLKDGSLEKWTSTSALTYWTEVDSTLTQTSTTRLFIQGTYSCKLSGAAGYLGQSIANNDDLKYLRGRHVVFKGRGWSDTASSLRLAIYDGTTLTYSDYHPGNSSWDTENSTWQVEADISETATEVAFRVYHDQAAATDYVDDLRVIGPFYPKVWIGDLNLDRDTPRYVGYFPIEKTKYEPLPLRNYKIDSGYLYLPEYPTDGLLRITGAGYLDFLASGISSTAWTATVDINEPQLKILTANAAVYLYQQMILPNYSTGTNKVFKEGLAYWKGELENRIAKYKMPLTSPMVDWGF